MKGMALKINSRLSEKKKKKPLIKQAVLDNIQESLIQSHAELIVRGLIDNKARNDLKHVVVKEHQHVHHGDEEIINYIVSETVGTGIIEQLVKEDTSITDITYNGSDLIIEGNDKKEKYNGNVEITEDYIIRIIQKFANANGKDFTPKNPIFDGRFENIRINAVHRVNNVAGTSMSLRVVRPKLALTKENFRNFAPEFVLDLFEKLIQLRTNIVISGETGTGKTELQKLLSSFIHFDHKTILIEDTPETFLKEMFPEKDITSWVTSPSVTITHLVKAALRNNPRWILVSETRGEEAYQMYQGVLSGHHLITSLHAVNADSIPTRFVNMAKMGYQVEERQLEEDFKRYLDLGVHIKRVKYDGKVVRYLSEIVEFNVEGNIKVFQQKFKDGRFIVDTGDISDSLKERLDELSININYPTNEKGLIRNFKNNTAKFMVDNLKTI